MCDIANVNTYGYAQFSRDAHERAKSLKMISNSERAVLKCIKKGDIKSHCSFCNAEVHLEKRHNFFCCSFCWKNISIKKRILIHIL